MAGDLWVVCTVWPKTGLKSEAVFDDYSAAWWYRGCMTELGAHSEINPEPETKYSAPCDFDEEAACGGRILSNIVVYVAMGALALMFLFAFLYFRELHNV